LSEAALASPRLKVSHGTGVVDLGHDGSVRDAAHSFCTILPYRKHPYCKRNWGGQLHSLCSYQGKLKPAIAHFLVRDFTRPSEVVLDPMGGVGTIPLEARLQGRVGVAGDLNPLAAIVSKAKLEHFNSSAVETVLAELADYLVTQRDDLAELVKSQHANFGLNGQVADYFDRQTLREILLARRFFGARLDRISTAESVVLTALLHILHGNRPYALSRRSHPITPFRPTGPTEYRSVLAHVRARIDRVGEALSMLEGDGHSYLSSFTDLPLRAATVDVVITSPPFAQSLRFFSSNWMRLWLCGWTPDDFRRRPLDFIEHQQAADFDAPYRRFLVEMARLLRPGGLLIMHLGESRRLDMAARIAALVESPFTTLYIGREDVTDTESHGFRDKGTTHTHGFLFCRRS
jgi:hypothetical protein